MTPKMQAGQYAGSYVFKVDNVPNDPEVIARFKRTFRGIGHVRARGRGRRNAPAIAAGHHKSAFYQSIPLKYADRVTIYVFPRADVPPLDC